ncbi:MAG: hypothetical protein JJT82_03665 [Legionellaceae bacterium]|nr:hypothetical protein [Legionellaceae bacterium]
MKKAWFFFTLLSFVPQSFAGLYALTHHSRANCFGFNETISWWAFHSFFARVISEHYPHGKDVPNSEVHHTIDTDKQYRYRHPAYHATEAYVGSTYRVRGYHYMYINGNPSLVQVDNVIDCSIYDGWWD